ncbi:MAG TPA: FAD-dependent oxidoreductase, partial [Candidatus Limnocylindria bacterium]|nr:FAD-dependent oxidoreductase [Candidatus Limnocylindria bacterium]
MERKKVGIIGGGGAGLTTAWLLEHEYDVVVFEKKDHVGGHAYTLYLSTDAGVTVPIELGAEFFNDFMFTHFMRLLKILEVSTSLYPLSYTFFSPASTMCIPPV